MTTTRDEVLALADKIADWTPADGHPLTLIAHERRMIVAALRRSSPIQGREAVKAKFLDIGGATSSNYGAGKIEVREITIGEGWAWRSITPDERAYLLDCLNRRAALSTGAPGGGASADTRAQRGGGE